MRVAHTAPKGAGRGNEKTPKGVVCAMHIAKVGFAKVGFAKVGFAKRRR